VPEGGHAGGGNGTATAGGNGSGGAVNLDWLAGFGDLLGDSPVGGLGGNLGAGGFGPAGGTGGLGELSFLDMELGSSWWTNVVRLLARRIESRSLMTGALTSAPSSRPSSSLLRAIKADSPAYSLFNFPRHASPVPLTTIMM
jgi:hypothetical protein